MTRHSLMSSLGISWGATRTEHFRMCYENILMVIEHHYSVADYFPLNNKLKIGILGVWGSRHEFSLFHVVLGQNKLLYCGANTIPDVKHAQKTTRGRSTPLQKKNNNLWNRGHKQPSWIAACLLRKQIGEMRRGWRTEEEEKRKTNLRESRIRKLVSLLNTIPHDSNRLESSVICLVRPQISHWRAF